MDNYSQQLADIIQKMTQGVGRKHDLPSGFVINTNEVHGPVGVFGAQGIDRELFSTHVKATGLLSRLPAVGTNLINPIVGYLTGYSDESGDEPEGACEDCVQVGEMYGCREGSVFGRICRETKPLEINTIGRQNALGETMDYSLVNPPTIDPGLIMGLNVPADFQQVMNNVVLQRWMALGVGFERKLGTLLYTGNPANNVGEGYAEYSGLELLVKTGHTDVLTQTSCPSLDSLIYDMNYATVEDEALLIYQWLQAGWRVVNDNAAMMGFTPVQWAFVMPTSLFRQLTDYWPCVYATGRCYGSQSDTGLTNNVDAMVMRQMSDEMFNGKYLRIDGMDIPVITDDFFPVEKNGDAGSELPSGSFASGIYLLPFTVRNGRRVLFMEYFDFSKAAAAAQMGNLSNSYWTDGGRWLWTFSRTNWCVSWKAKIESRLRLLTPHLAVRWQNVKWSPLANARQPLPTDPYYVLGGSSTFTNSPY